MKTIMTLLLLLAFCASTQAAGSDCWGLGDGWNCVDRLQLQAGTASGNAFVINDSAKAAKFTVTHAGNVTMAGTLTGPTLIDITAPYTFTADVTLSGDGTDLLFNAANQNTIGADTKGAKVIFTRAITNETSTALTITGASGIGLVGATTITGDIIPEADGTRDLGSRTVRFAEAHIDSLFISPPATATTTSAMTAFVTRADTTGLGAVITLTLPDAATNAGRIMGLVLVESTTQDVEVTSAGGTLGLTDRSDAGVAAGTVVTFTNTDENKEAFWQSNGTDWVLLWGSLVVD